MTMRLPIMLYLMQKNAKRMEKSFVPKESCLSQTYDLRAADHSATLFLCQKSDLRINFIKQKISYQARENPEKV